MKIQLQDANMNILKDINEFWSFGAFKESRWFKQSNELLKYPKCTKSIQETSKKHFLQSIENFKMTFYRLNKDLQRTSSISIVYKGLDKSITTLRLPRHLKRTFLGPSKWSPESFKISERPHIYLHGIHKRPEIWILKTGLSKVISQKWTNKSRPTKVNSQKWTH